MPDSSPRMGIPSPLGGEAPNTNAAYKAIADAVDALAAIYGQGTLAARPVSTPGSPGKQGRLYMVTSGAETGQFFYDYGTGWTLVNPDQSVGAGEITDVELAANAVTQSKILDGAVTTSKIPDAAITFAKLAAALKPSQGAGGASEALRALGTAAGTAAAGTHASQHAPGGADRVNTIQRVSTIGAATAYEGALAEIVVGTTDHMLMIYDATLGKWVSLWKFYWSFTAAARGTIWRGGINRGDDYHNENAVTDVGPWLHNKVWRDAGLRPQIRAAAAVSSVAPQGGRYHIPIRGWSADPDAGPSGTIVRPVDVYGGTSEPTWDTQEVGWTQFDIGDYEFMNICGSIAGNHVTLAGGAAWDWWQVRWVNA